MSTSDASPADRLLTEFHLTAAPQARDILVRALSRGLISPRHFRRTFVSLRASQSLPSHIDEKFAGHFTMWLEIINQPYFKPVITRKNRLDRLMGLLAANPYVDMSRPGRRLVDLGTGQPPYTTVDLAEAFPDAEVHGFDLYHPSWLVVRPDGAYGLLDSAGRVLSVHCQDALKLHDMIVNWRETEAKFRGMFRVLENGGSLLNRRLRTLNGSSKPAASDWILADRPTERLRQECANRNLHFHVNQEGCFDLRPLDDGSVDVIWSFNCLLHYSLEVKRKALESLKRKLKPGGIIIEGYTSPPGSHAVYTIWQRNLESLAAREFGFSANNFRYPLWPLHDRDLQVEAMSELVSSVKSDEGLGQEINNDLVATGSVTDQNLQRIAGFLKRKGYSAGIRQGEFVVAHSVPDSLQRLASSRALVGCQAGEGFATTA